MEIFINILFLFLGFILINKSQKRYVSYVNHLSIFGFVWPFITIGTQLAYPGALSIEVVILYYFCWLFYIFGSSLLRHKSYNNDGMDSVSIPRIKVLIVFLVIFNIISNWEIFKLILSTQNLLAWAALRKENGFENLESNIFFTLFQRAYLVYIPLGIFLYKNNKITKKFLISLIFLGVVFSSLKFTRAPILNLFIVLLISYVYIYRKKLPVFSIVLSIIIVFIAFGGSVLILKEGANDYKIFDDVKLYLFSGQVAYQDFLDGKYIDNMKYDVNNYSLDFINYILKKIGLIETYPSYVRDYSTRFGVFTNIYTYLDTFTYDLGVIGGLLGSFFIGFFSDYVYHLFIKRRNIFVLIFYGYICYYNCFVFANNEFVRFAVLLTAVSLFLYNLLVNEKKYASKKIR